MKTRIRTFCVAISLLAAGTTRAQTNYEIGISYRYVKYNEASIGFTHMNAEYLHPHELDANFRFDISSDHKFRGTLVIGWTKYENSYTTFPDPFFTTSCPPVMTFSETAQEYNAYRFNPGMEYEMEKGKISYSCGAGLFYYGMFHGNQAQFFTSIYQHKDSLTGECIEDSTIVVAGINTAPRRTIALVGISANLYFGYEAFTGITFFAMAGVNPTFSIDTHRFATKPSLSAGVYFRFHRRFKE